MASRAIKKTVRKWQPQSHLFYWLSKITDICSGSIDEFNLSKETLPELLAKVQDDCRIKDITDAGRYVKKLKEYVDGLEKHLKLLENQKRNGL